MILINLENTPHGVHICTQCANHYFSNLFCICSSSILTQMRRDRGWLASLKKCHTFCYCFLAAFTANLYVYLWVWVSPPISIQRVRTIFIGIIYYLWQICRPRVLARRQLKCCPFAAWLSVAPLMIHDFTHPHHHQCYHHQHHQSSRHRIIGALIVIFGEKLFMQWHIVVAYMWAVRWSTVTGAKQKVR